MANAFTPEQIAQILEEFFKTVGTRQYIGARYVPIFGRKDETSIEWDNTKPYEPLTVVLYQGNSYTSRQYVPEGVEITNEAFWALTFNFNAQVELYRQEAAQALQTAQEAQQGVINIDNKISSFYFATVSDMQQSQNLKAGMICQTGGFHAEGDGGAALYTIDTEKTPNNFDVFALANNLYATLLPEGDYIYPEQVGAYGNGTNDDSDTLSYAINNYKVNLKGVYYVTKSLAASLDSFTVDISGRQTHHVWYDLTGLNSCILVEDGVTLFSGIANFMGSFDGIAIVGKGANGQTSDTTQYVFSDCNLRNFKFANSFVYNFEAVFLNTSCTSNTIIKNNVFLSCYYFFKITDVNNSFYFNDSLLDGNYINGGSKYNNNSCFQLNTLSNSIVTNNFIDFYRSIYDPTVNGARNTSGDLAITSIGNRYEVFRYFIFTPTLNSNRRVIAQFIGDKFTHIDVERAAAEFNLNRYEKQVNTYGGVSYEIHPYLLYVWSNTYTNWQVTFRDVTFAADAFVEHAPFNCTGNSPFSGSRGCKLVFEYSKYSALLMPELMETQSGILSFYGDNDDFIKTNFFKVLDAAPDVTAGYEKGYIPGATYIYNNVSYKCVKFFQSIWKIAFINHLGEATYRQA